MVLYQHDLTIVFARNEEGREEAKTDGEAVHERSMDRSVHRTVLGSPPARALGRRDGEHGTFSGDVTSISEIPGLGGAGADDDVEGAIIIRRIILPSLWMINN